MQTCYSKKPHTILFQKKDQAPRKSQFKGITPVTHRVKLSVGCSMCTHKDDPPSCKGEESFATVLNAQTSYHHGVNC